MNADIQSLPSNVNAERFILGSILLKGQKFVEVAGSLTGPDFTLEKHRRIFASMGCLYEQGEEIDRVTVANELARKGELESIDGLSYLNSLDEGLPFVANLESYVRIIQNKTLLRRIAITSQQIMKRALSDAEDGHDVLAGAEREFLQLSGSDEMSGPLTPMQIIQSYEGGVNAFLDPSKRAKGITTGFTKLDEMTNGLHPGDLAILAARPSMGKTALALNIAWHVAARLFSPAVIFSLEMSRESLMTRMLCASARVDSQRFRSGYLNETERQKLRQTTGTMLELPIHIDDTAGISLMQIHSRLRKLEHQSERPLGLVVVDYLQLMGGNRNENRNQEVSYLSQGLKNMAKELKCPFLVLSQLSRAPETRTGDHRPILSDLRESGAIEQDADLVMFLFREEVYKRDREDLRGVAELLLSKQRNGPVGKIDLVFLHTMTKFENRGQDISEERES